MKEACMYQLKDFPGKVVDLVLEKMYGSFEDGKAVSKAQYVIFVQEACVEFVLTRPAADVPFPDLMDLDEEIEKITNIIDNAKEG